MHLDNSWCEPTIKVFYYISLFQVLLLFYAVLSVSTIACIDDVAVIDEAQMIQNNERGFAWTRVILGKTTYSYHIPLSFYICVMYTVFLCFVLCYFLCQAFRLKRYTFVVQALQ